jgi:hypothetical protein
MLASRRRNAAVRGTGSVSPWLRKTVFLHHLHVQVHPGLETIEGLEHRGGNRFAVVEAYPRDAGGSRDQVEMQHLPGQRLTALQQKERR